MTEARVVERLRALQLLVSRPEVDRRVGVARCPPAVVVEVAVVDVDPDAAEMVDDLLEAVEVDRRSHHLETLCLSWPRTLRLVPVADMSTPVPSLLTTRPGA